METQGSVTKFEQICPVTNEDGKQWVNARQLHAALQVGKIFAAWIKERIEKYGFIEGQEFFPNLEKTSPEGGRPAIEYKISISMAKQLCMVENNEIGKLARKYFIACEEKLKHQYYGYNLPRIPQSFSDALRMVADIEEEKQKAIAERDHAIKTKAEIGSKREATAMNTASIVVKERDKMADQLGEGKTWKQVKAIGWLGNYFNTRKAGFWSVIGKSLTKLSKLMDYPVNSIPSSEYPNGLNRYHVEVIEQFRINLDMDENLLHKYRTK